MSPMSSRFARFFSLRIRIGVNGINVTAVFHRECAGISKAEIKRTPLIACSQHACSSCGRSTQQSGGMLFRYDCEFCLNEINTFYATHPQMSDLPQSVL